MKAKICGITTIDDARLACELGAWAVGFIFHKPSPRYVAPERVAEITAALPGGIEKVGVFVNRDAGEVNRVARSAGLTLVQLHGDEGIETCAAITLPVIKALRLKGTADVEAASRFKNIRALLAEAAVDGQFGGTGQLSNWDLARALKSHGDVLLSGGLTAENVADAIRAVKPYAVDVASGVESAPGRKDPRKLELFFERIKA